MRQVYFIPNIITAFSLACGLLVIFKTNMIQPGEESLQILTSSVLLLLVAAFADLLDGMVARAIRAESEFGVVFDSLADAVSFGVAPSVLFLKSLSLEQGTGLSFFALLGSMVFSICGILRLVRFNVKANEARGNAEEMAAQKRHFNGLPIPAGALGGVSSVLLFFSPFFQEFLPMSSYVRAIVLTSQLLLLGYLMICPLKFPSIKALHFRVPSFQLVFVTVILAIGFLYGILYFFASTLALLSWGYILLGLTLSFIRLIAGKKSKTLEEFEPEEED